MRIQMPQTGRKRSRRGVREGDESPENSEEKPAGCGLRVLGAVGVADAAHAEREHECPGEEHGGEGHLPHPVHGVLEEGWIEGPEPCRPEGDAAVVAACGDFVDAGHDGS